jgi:nitrous oxidase accessory protein
MSNILRIAVVVVLLFLLVESGSAATLTVNASGDADYTRIQDAVNASSNGDMILVQSGTYFENVNVNKQLILKGVDTGNGKPVVDAGKEGDAITLSADWITLEGFNATNASSWYSGIMINSNHSTVIGNDVSRNNQGIFLYYSNNNNISANNATSNGAGFFLYSSTNNTLHDNNACNNIYAIYLFSNTYDVPTSNNTIYNNFFNNINGLGLIGTNNNFWNITSNSGTNIIGGSYLGGNFWGNPSGTGFSQTCIDNEGDGICDSSYVLGANNTDHLPLAALPKVRFINGTIKDNSTGNHLAGVIVSANSTLSTMSNTTGFYSFAVTEGTYNLTAYDIRYYMNTTTVSTVGKVVVVKDIELLKKPTGNITGSVTTV